MAANTATNRRLALEAQIADHNKTMAGMLARGDVLSEALQIVKAEEEQEKSKQVYIMHIEALLETARNALEEAGRYGEEHGINFTFDGPREKIEFNVNWMSSDCYGSERWYDQGYNPENR